MNGEKPQIPERALGCVTADTQTGVGTARARLRMLQVGQGGTFGGSQSQNKPHGAASPSRAAFSKPFPPCAEQGWDDNSGWHRRVNFTKETDTLLSSAGN